MIVLVSVALAGCAADRARLEWNLKHAYVTPWTHLSSSDREEIIRIISRDSEEHIIGIAEHRPSPDGSTISVFTGETNQKEYKFWTGYDLKKHEGKWRVTFFGASSPIIAKLALSKQGHELEERRR
jgi:hypothetical protein